MLTKLDAPAARDPNAEPAAYFNAIHSTHVIARFNPERDANACAVKERDGDLDQVQLVAVHA